MFVELQEAELRELISLLEDSIAALRSELRHTEDREFKEWLRQKQVLLERILGQCLSTPIAER